MAQSDVRGVRAVPMRTRSLSDASRRTRAELASLEEELTSHEADIRQLLDELPNAAPDRRKEMISTFAQLEGIMEKHQSKIDSVLSGHLKSGQSEVRERRRALHARCEKLLKDLELAWMQACRDVREVHAVPMRTRSLSDASRQTRAEPASLEEELTSHEAVIRQLLDEFPDAAPHRQKEMISTFAQLEGIMMKLQSKIDSVLSGHLKSGQSEARERRRALNARRKQLLKDLELACEKLLKDFDARCEKLAKELEKVCWLTDLEKVSLPPLPPHSSPPPEEMAFASTPEDMALLGTGGNGVGKDDGGKRISQQDRGKLPLSLRGQIRLVDQDVLPLARSLGLAVYDFDGKYYVQERRTSETLSLGWADPNLAHQLRSEYLPTDGTTDTALGGTGMPTSESLQEQMEKAIEECDEDEAVRLSQLHRKAKIREIQAAREAEARTQMYAK